MATFPSISHKILDYENPYQQIFRIKADFGTFTKEYFVNDHGEKSGILILQDGQVLLVGQYRLLVNRLAWEIPGGKIDENESAETAAIRETLEETGIECRSLQPLITYQVGMDIVKTKTQIFYTHECEQIQDFIPCEKEVESLKWVHFQECVDMVFQGEIVDSFTIIALLTYQTLQSRSRGRNFL